MAKIKIKIKEVSLRPRTKKDEEFLRKAYESSRDEETKDVIWNIPEQRAIFFRQQYDAQQIHFDNFYQGMDYDIIEYNGKPIGRLCLLWLEKNLECVDIILIGKYRRQKIGSAIMDAIVKEVDRRKITASLMYEKWKPYLEKFYERYGFKVTGDVPTHVMMERGKLSEPGMSEP
jgi:GNAT superfamily N-acetyltransferase